MSLESTSRPIWREDIKTRDFSRLRLLGLGKVLFFFGGGGERVGVRCGVFFVFGWLNSIQFSGARRSTWGWDWEVMFRINTKKIVGYFKKL